MSKIKKYLKIGETFLFEHDGEKTLCKVVPKFDDWCRGCHLKRANFFCCHMRNQQKCPECHLGRPREKNPVMFVKVTEE